VKVINVGPMSTRQSLLGYRCADNSIHHTALRIAIEYGGNITLDLGSPSNEAKSVLREIMLGSCIIFPDGPIKIHADFNVVTINNWSQLK